MILNLKMEKRNVYIIVTVGLVVALVLSLGNYTGFSTNPSGAVGTCIDSDANEEFPEGINYYKKGSVSYTNRDKVFTDYCYQKSAKGEKEWLKEYYCMDTINSVTKLCENGCFDGACIK